MSGKAVYYTFVVKIPICHKMSQFDDINEKDVSRIKLLLNSINLKRVFNKRA